MHVTKKIVKLKLPCICCLNTKRGMFAVVRKKVNIYLQTHHPNLQCSVLGACDANGKDCSGASWTVDITDRTGKALEGNEKYLKSAIKGLKGKVDGIAKRFVRIRVASSHKPISS